MTPRFVAVALVVTGLLAPGIGRGQEQLRLFRGQEQGPVEIRAQELSAVNAAESQRVDARGDVVLTWRGYRLTAEQASYDHRTGVAEAQGSVTLEDRDGNVVTCRHLTIDVATEQGIVEDGSLLVAREGYRVWGKRFQKTGPETYRVEDGGFTACDGTWPSWRVNATRVDVALEGYLTSRHAVFWVEGVPVVYTPYLLFPVKRQRQSGFLLPKLGYSSRDGSLLVTRYYWAMGDNADLLARLEYRSRRGWTEVGELRYVLAEGHEGTAEVSHLSDRSTGSERYTVKMDHDSRFDNVDRLRLHVDYLGDTKYLQDFGDTIDDRGKDRLESYLLATRDVEVGTVFGFADYFQALHEPQGEVLQTLPAAGVEGRETPLLGALAWDPTVRLTRFFRETGTGGERLQVQPGLSWDAAAGGMGLALRAGYREQLYRVDGDLIAHGAPRAEISGTTTFARDFSGVVHTVEPTVGFAWEDRGQGSTPPVFDAADRFAARAELGLLIESRLLRRSDLSEFAACDVGRTLDLGRARRDGFADAWGPWTARLSAAPRERMALRAEAAFDPRLRDPWVLGSLSGEDGDSRGDRVFAGYHRVGGRAGYLDAGVEVAVTPPLALQYRHRRDLREARTLEEGVGVRLSHTCWEVLATFSRNYRAEEDRVERRYLLAVQLKGLGKLGTLRGIVP